MNMIPLYYCHNDSFLGDICIWILLSFTFHFIFSCVYQSIRPVLFIQNKDPLKILTMRYSWSMLFLFFLTIKSMSNTSLASFLNTCAYVEGLEAILWHHWVSEPIPELPFSHNLHHWECCCCLPSKGKDKWHLYFVVLRLFVIALHWW